MLVRQLEKISPSWVLAEGKTIGEAMRDARLEIKGADPTWLAYTLYADPLTKVIFV